MKTKTAQFMAQLLEEYIDLQAINQAGAMQVRDLQYEIEELRADIEELKEQNKALEDAAESAWQEVQNSRGNGLGYAENKRRAQEIAGIEVSP